jgi:hypothetical protein
MVLAAAIWDGAGVGGSTGASYHWTAHSYSPITGREIQIHYTHNHNGWGNYNGSEGWTVGAHLEFPYKGTRPRGWLDQANATEAEGEEGAGGENKETDAAAAAAPAEGEEEKPEEEQSASAKAFPQRWPYLNMSGYDYFAKMFPVEKGYSAYIFGNATVEPEAGAEEEDANAEVNTEEQEEVKDAEEEAEGEAEEEQRLRGVKSPMVFNDLPVIGNFTPIQKSNDIVKVKFPEWWIV